MTAIADTSLLAGCRILVVEDEYFMADDMVRALRAAGAEILGPINDTDEALRVIRDVPHIEGAVLDINVRGTTIYAVADALRQRGAPFVFATGYDQAAIPSSYREIPRWEKPFDPAALVRSLPATLRRDKGQATG